MKRSFIKDPYLKLWLPLYELDGNSFMSKDIYGHLCVATGTTWGIQGRTFASGNYITATIPQMNFTTESFSILVWINITSLAAARHILCRGLYTTDGYFLNVTATGRVQFDTFQAGAVQVSNTAAGSIVINTWYLLAVVRSGASVTIYRDGVDITSTRGTHVNPLTSARTVKIGIYDNLTDEPFIGTMDGILVPSRDLNAAEVQNYWLATKWRHQ